MKIAVIGAGIAGLTTAYRLQQRGHNVTVFEKNLYSGGKCCTLYLGESICELGNTLGAANHNRLRRLMKEFSIAEKPVYFYNNYTDDYGNIIPQIPQDKLPELHSQYSHLLQEIASYSEYFSAPGMDAIPDELCMPFSRWCDSRELSLMPMLVAPPFTGFGGGRLNEMPAAYVLKYLDTETLNSYIKPTKHIAIKNGTTELCARIASKLNDIRYNQEVIQIYGYYPVHVQTHIGEYSFDSVVLTVPMAKRCESAPHANLMRKYRIIPFRVFAYRSKSLPMTNLFFPSALGANSDHTLMLIHRPTVTGTEGIFNCYCYGRENITKCWEDVERELEQAGISKTSLLAYHHWDNFPHVGSADLHNEFYKRLNDCQGENGIYLAGGLASLSTMERLIQYSDYFVDKYF